MLKWSVVGIFASFLLFAVTVGIVAASPSQHADHVLKVARSDDRMSATAEWSPSHGAERQLFFYVGLLLIGEEDTTGIGLHLASYREVPLAGDVDSLVIEDLDPKREYVYVVGREDVDSDGKKMWSDLLIAWKALEPTSAATDREALVALYNAADGDNWRRSDNWMGEAPLGEWYGVTTDADGRVVSLSLWLNDLGGTLPPEIGNLAKLERLNLSLNRLQGPMPSEIGNLASLRELNLLANKLTGEIPPSLGGLLNLEKLNLSIGNQFTGCIPDSLQNVAMNDLSELGLPFCS